MRISVACHKPAVVIFRNPVAEAVRGYSASRDNQLVLPTDADCVLIELTVGLTLQGGRNEPKKDFLIDFSMAIHNSKILKSQILKSRLEVQPLSK